jgi:hypothetical protein
MSICPFMYIHLSVHLYHYLSICMSICPFVYLSVHLYVYLSICMSICPFYPNNINHHPTSISCDNLSLSLTVTALIRWPRVWPTCSSWRDHGHLSFLYICSFSLSIYLCVYLFSSLSKWYNLSYHINKLRQFELEPDGDCFWYVDHGSDQLVIVG